MTEYKTHTSTVIPFEYLKKLVEENPNDADLGKRIRSLTITVPKLSRNAILNSKS
tara:strand:- start:585 stop:749 length:165 start_codon:yes stop_codon:yes gene_type:complete